MISQNPFFCEYGHAMGNGSGALKEYQEVFRTHRRLQGGFQLGVDNPRLLEDGEVDR